VDMIRTKEQLIAALADGGRLIGHMGNRPSAPWSYEVRPGVPGPAVTVHGNAFWAADKAGLLKPILRDWHHCIYRIRSARKPDVAIPGDNKLPDNAEQQ
jgi:hypothetical protein